VFGVQCLLLVFTWVLSATISGLMVTVYGGMAGMTAAMVTGLPLAWLVGNALVATLTSAVGALVLASLYIELRESKEGPAIDRLAEVFG
jgi:predicted MFS family arabinose efflux permease